MSIIWRIKSCCISLLPVDDHCLDFVEFLVPLVLKSLFLFTYMSPVFMVKMNLLVSVFSCPETKSLPVLL